MVREIEAGRYRLDASSSEDMSVPTYTSSSTIAVKSSSNGSVAGVVWPPKGSYSSNGGGSSVVSYGSSIASGSGGYSSYRNKQRKDRYQSADRYQMPSTVEENEDEEKEVQQPALEGRDEVEHQPALEGREEDVEVEGSNYLQQSDSRDATYYNNGEEASEYEEEATGVSSYDWSARSVASDYTTVTGNTRANQSSNIMSAASTSSNTSTTNLKSNGSTSSSSSSGSSDKSHRRMIDMTGEVRSFDSDADETTVTNRDKYANASEEEEQSQEEGETVSTATEASSVAAAIGGGIGLLGFSTLKRFRNKDNGNNDDKNENLGLVSKEELDNDLRESGLDKVKEVHQLVGDGASQKSNLVGRNVVAESSYSSDSSDVLSKDSTTASSSVGASAGVACNAASATTTQTTESKKNVRFSNNIEEVEPVEKSSLADSEDGQKVTQEESLGKKKSLFKWMKKRQKQKARKRGKKKKFAPTLTTTIEGDSEDQESTTNKDAAEAEEEGALIETSSSVTTQDVACGLATCGATEQEVEVKADPKQSFSDVSEAANEPEEEEPEIETDEGFELIAGCTKSGKKAILIAKANKANREDATNKKKRNHFFTGILKRKNKQEQEQDSDIMGNVVMENDPPAEESVEKEENSVPRPESDDYSKTNESSASGEASNEGSQTSMISWLFPGYCGETTTAPPQLPPTVLAPQQAPQITDEDGQEEINEAKIEETTEDAGNEETNEDAEQQETVSEDSTVNAVRRNKKKKKLQELPLEQKKLKDEQWRKIYEASATLATVYKETPELNSSMDDELKNAVAMIQEHAARLGVQERQLMELVQNDERSIKSGLVADDGTIVTEGESTRNGGSLATGTIFSTGTTRTRGTYNSYDDSTMSEGNQMTMQLVDLFDYFFVPKEVASL